MILLRSDLGRGTVSNSSFSSSPFAFCGFSPEIFSPAFIDVAKAITWILYSSYEVRYPFMQFPIHYGDPFREVETKIISKIFKAKKIVSTLFDKIKKTSKDMGMK